MQLWSEVRRRVLAEGLSKRQACREYGLHWHTLTKILAHTEPPGYRQARPRPKRKLEPLLPIIHEILKQDQHAPALPPQAVCVDPRPASSPSRRVFGQGERGPGYAGTLGARPS